MENKMAFTPEASVRKHATYIRFAINMAAEKCGGTVRDYSGRFMYGAQCVGVQVTNPLMFAGIVGVFAGRNENLDVGNAALTGMCWDEMGKDFIVYWPDLEPAEGLNS